MTRYYLAAAAALLAACGADTDAPETARSAASPETVAAAPVVDMAAFTDACTSHYGSDYRRLPRNATAEAFCECIVDEWEPSMAKAMPTFEQLSGENVMGEPVSVRASSSMTAQIDTYLASVAQGDDVDPGPGGYVGLGYFTDDMASNTCFLKLR